MRDAVIVKIALAATLASCLFGASLDGVWQTEGWGLVYQIRGADWQTLELTSTTLCRGNNRETGSTNGGGIGPDFPRQERKAILDSSQWRQRTQADHDGIWPELYRNQTDH